MSATLDFCKQRIAPARPPSAPLQSLYTVADMSEPSPSSKPSPDGPPRKRKRKTYSCIDCRRRKLKCDREQPCSRCQKEGHPQTCIFNAESGAEFNGSEIEEPDGVFRNLPTTAPKRPSNSVHLLEVAAERNRNPSDGHYESTSYLKNKIEQLESRIALLESSSTRSTAMPAFLGARPRQSGSEGTYEKTRMVKGKGTVTHFFGATNATSMLIHVCSISVTASVN